MQTVATLLSTRHLGYTVYILTDGSLFIGAFCSRPGFADFIPGTGSRDLLSTLNYIEDALELGRALPPRPRTIDEWEEKRAAYAQDGQE